MNFKTILVHLDHSDRCAARTALAARWAGAHGSHLVGLVPSGRYDGVIPADAIAPEVGDFIAASADYLRRRAETIGREFEQAVAATGAVAHELRVVDAATTDAVVQHGRASDLVVLGRDGGSGARDVAVHGLVGHVLMEVGRPVLVVPCAGDFEGVARNAVVAWNGSREAAVALQAALPALQRALRVTLVDFRRPQEAGDDRPPSAAEMLRFLARHGIQASFERDVAGSDVAAALLSRVSELGADLLVMGGYGHPRVQEMVLGGVTRQILARASVPVLMAH
ncbi:nucleotide-binding universal stress UspA family protein [Variovorax paradoxus]|uniref:universal stress protein n=1 Tax=Variovorax paradoxus TaxID=34073 RepID=UPI001AE4ECAD|nr:universal stress protein [Variovorax paradoxus]MDP9964505.1 nucleotide-binding universal stress UspA family protein [Variovorax paradoxus]